MMSHVLVTGGAGYIGSHTCECHCEPFLCHCERSEAISVGDRHGLRPRDDGQQSRDRRGLTASR